MQIKPIHTSNIQDYQALSAMYGSIFNDLKWAALFGGESVVQGIYDNDNQLVGGFYLYFTKQAGFTFYKNPPYTPTIELFFNNKTQNKANSAAAVKTVMQLLADYFSRLPYGVLKLALPAGYVDMQPFMWNKFKVIPNYTYQIDLRQPLDTISANMSPERRNDIKKAAKDLVRVEQTNDYQLVKLMVEKTFGRKDMAVNTKILDNILFNFSTNENSFAFISYYKDKPSAASFCLFDSKTAYYLLGGYDAENRHQGAGASAVWAAVQYAQKMNLTTFDFEGSMIPAIEKYFRGFGGDIKPYYTVNKAKLPFEFVLKLIKREYF